MSKIKIVMLSSLPPVISGISTHTLNLSEELSKLGIEINIISFLNKNSLKQNNIKLYGLNQYSYFDAAGLYSILKPSATKKAIELIKEIKPDLVHFHHRTSSIEFSLEDMKKKTGLNFVNTFHSSCGSMRFNVRDVVHLIHFKNLCKVLKKASDRVITVSEFNKSKLIENKVKNVAVISNGVNIKQFDAVDRKKARNKFGYSDNDIIILFVGRHSTEKGLHYLLWVFNKLSKKYSNIKLVTVGDGPLLSTYKFVFNSKRIRFCGRVDNETLIRHYKASDMFVLPSVWPEPNPVVLFEAMASKLPIVGFGVGGVPEIVKKCKSGSVIKPSTDELERKIELFIKNDELRLRYGLNGYRNVKDYTWNKIARKTKKIYDSVK